MALDRVIRRGWSVWRPWRGPAWEYTILTVHHTLYRDGASSIADHSVVVLRDGIVQATITHAEALNPSINQRVQSTWFERYLPGLLDDLGQQGWRIVSFAYSAPIRVVFARRR